MELDYYTMRISNVRGRTQRNAGHALLARKYSLSTGRDTSTKAGHPFCSVLYDEITLKKIKQVVTSATRFHKRL